MAEPKQKTKKVPGLRVRAQVNGFRRAGRAWSAESVDVAASEFTKAQIEALRAEPQLVVEDIDLDIAAE